MIFDARNSSRRWMMYTLLPYLVRKWASSMAAGGGGRADMSMPGWQQLCVEVASVLVALRRQVG